MSQLCSPVSDWIAAFNTRDLGRIVALYSEDAELFDSGMRRPRKGKREIEDWFKLRFSSMPTNVYTPRLDAAHVEENGQVVVPWTLDGRGPRLLGRARRFVVKGESRFTLREDLICEQRGSYDHLVVLKQVLPPLKYLPTRLVWSIYYLYLRLHKQ